MSPEPGISLEQAREVFKLLRRAIKQEGFPATYSHQQQPPVFSYQIKPGDDQKVIKIKEFIDEKIVLPIKTLEGVNSKTVYTFLLYTIDNKKYEEWAKTKRVYRKNEDEQKHKSDSASDVTIIDQPGDGNQVINLDAPKLSPEETRAKFSEALSSAGVPVKQVVSVPNSPGVVVRINFSNTEELEKVTPFLEKLPHQGITKANRDKPQSLTMELKQGIDYLALLNGNEELKMFFGGPSVRNGRGRKKVLKPVEESPTVTAAVDGRTYEQGVADTDEKWKTHIRNYFAQLGEAVISSMKK